MDYALDSYPEPSLNPPEREELTIEAHQEMVEEMADALDWEQVDTLIHEFCDTEIICNLIKRIYLAHKYDKKSVPVFAGALACEFESGCEIALPVYERGKL